MQAVNQVINVASAVNPAAMNEKLAQVRAIIDKALEGVSSAPALTPAEYCQMWEKLPSGSDLAGVSEGIHDFVEIEALGRLAAGAPVPPSVLAAEAKGLQDLGWSEDFWDKIRVKMIQEFKGWGLDELQRWDNFGVEMSSDIAKLSKQDRELAKHIWTAVSQSCSSY